MDKKYWYLIGGVVLGIVFSAQIRRIPGINKIPTI